MQTLNQKPDGRAKVVRRSKHFMMYVWPGFFIKEIDFMRFWEGVVQILKRLPLGFVLDVFLNADFQLLRCLFGAFWALLVFGLNASVIFVLLQQYLLLMLPEFFTDFTYLTLMESGYLSVFANLGVLDLLSVCFLLFLF